MAIGSFAQFNKGSKMIGGSLSFNTNTSKSKSGNTTTTTEKSTEYSFTPSFGYFVIDNLAIGLGLNASISRSRPEADIYDTDNFSMRFQPFVRYYLDQRIFFHGEYGIGSGKQKYSYTGQDPIVDKYNLSHWALGAGYAILLNEHVTIDPMFGYGSSSAKDRETKDKDINSGFFIQVGIQVFLDKK